jgi:probable F420-dependent oxidoreductase
MKVDAGLIAADLAEVPARARELEAQGFDGCVTAEIASDPFLPLLLAAEHTTRLELMTSIAVAFARSPMTLANLGHDLNAFSKGRFLLGLGSQIQPHITKRFSMPWSHPAARMRELILAMRAIWRCWYEGEKLAFRGEFYTHTLMTPMFTPTNTAYGAPKVLLAAVGPKMTEVAGEVADGMIVHGFTTPKYVSEVTLPALERGLTAAGRSRKGFQLACPIFVVTGRSALEWERNRGAVCKQIAFYGSTPAYRGVLELHGWGELQGELNAMSKRGEWDAMGTRITDEILEQFAIVAQPHEVPAQLKKRYGDSIDRVLATFAFTDNEQRKRALAELRA